MTIRNSIRQEIRGRRRALDIAARAHAAEALTALLTALPGYHSAQHVAAYMSVDGEVDTKPLLLQAHRDGKHIYLPVLPAEHAAELRFHSWAPDTAMQQNRLQILEPVASDATGIEPRSLDLVLTPLVAFDSSGNRLGMGAGFYDRTFVFLKAGGDKPLMLGLAYEFQRLEHLEEASWDVPLAGVVTECHVYFFARHKVKQG
ncbi:MAG TPA: 5-formyltetrahydrofolate cyclo-ligase [Gammaproteobacteria bacterium]|nr:5-formyltetrahydrofolate cyclo-ligase [Gammaproteobacteria bacterium]